MIHVWIDVFWSVGCWRACKLSSQNWNFSVKFTVCQLKTNLPFSFCYQSFLLPWFFAHLLIFFAPHFWISWHSLEICLNLQYFYSVCFFFHSASCFLFFFFLLQIFSCSPSTLSQTLTCSAYKFFIHKELEWKCSFKCKCFERETTFASVNLQWQWSVLGVKWMSMRTRNRRHSSFNMVFSFFFCFCFLLIVKMSSSNDSTRCGAESPSGKSRPFQMNTFTFWDSF